MKAKASKIITLLAAMSLMGFATIAEAQNVTTTTTVGPNAIAHSRSVTRGRDTRTVRIIHGRHGVTCRVVRNTIHGYGRTRSVSRRVCR